MSGKPKRIPTQEEYEKDKQLILSAYRAGLPMRRMYDELGFTRTYIINMRDTLIEEGLITEDEIKLASKKYFKENPAAQGLNKTKVKKPKGTEKADKIHNQSLEKREKIYELVKQGYAQVQIAKTLEISQAVVSFHIKNLIEDRKNSKR